MATKKVQDTTVEIITDSDTAKYFAGCALTGMLSECRLGKLTDQELEMVCARASGIGKRMARLMGDVS